MNGSTAALPPAERLLTQADQLVRLGKLAEAAPLIRQAADIYATEGRQDDEARCLVLASTAARMAGAVSVAQEHAEAAGRSAPGGSRTAVSASAEVAESLLAAGRPDEAIGKYTAALELLHSSGIGEPAVEAVLLRKRGLARALADDIRGAIHDLESASDEFGVADQPRAQRAVLVEAATLATERSTPARGYELREQARTEAARANDYEAQVDLDLLEASMAVTRRDLGTAFTLTQRARRTALDGVAPIKYLSAAVALADLHDLRGEREAAYETLSTAWATLADLMDSNTARAVVQPRLQVLVDRWGVEEFRAVKQRYEARRRAELGMT
jgi:tetratricopeptide (TPR) repeat protein